MRVFSYVVARDFGFAPNPFYGVCTLATCKPQIRRVAMVGDWVVGTGGTKYGLSGRLVYAMRVTEKMTFNEYWNSPDYQRKRPYLSGSVKQAFGDNIYHRTPHGLWVQAPSHHSFGDNTPNSANTATDTSADAVLISKQFTYFGRSGPDIPAFLRMADADLCAGRGHRSIWPIDFQENIIGWLESVAGEGYVGEPSEF